MRLGEYGRIERDITAAANGTIYHRWRYGRRLLCDMEVTTPNGNFRHGVIEKIVRASGGKLSERELRARRQCGKAYPTRSQIRQALTDFETWNQLLDASFPPYEAEEDELPYNPLATEELVKIHNTGTERHSEDSQYEGGGIVPRGEYEEKPEGALIPRDTFPDTTPLHEIVRYREVERELARRFADNVQRLDLYVDSLIKAANGDLNVTLGEAERRLHGND